MFKIFGLKGQVLELRGLLEKERENNNKIRRKREEYLNQVFDLRTEIFEKDIKLEKQRIKLANQVNDLICYEKEIKELKEKIEKLENRNKAKDMYMINTSTQLKDLSNKYWDLKKGTDEIIQNYLINKYNLLVDQNAPRSMICLIKNLINEINC